MKRALLTTLMLSAACDIPSPPPSAAMPWVHGFNATSVNDLATPQAARQLSRLLEVPAEDDYGALGLRADLAGDAHAETVLASYRLGLVIVDGAGHILARTPGFDASGSADDLLTIAVGDGQLGVPVILVAVQTGGHHENTVSLAIYRMTGGRVLQQVFSAPIEAHEGSGTETGSLTFFRLGLRYRAPGARSSTRWTFDARRGRYVEHEPVTQARELAHRSRKI